MCYRTDLLLNRIVLSRKLCLLTVAYVQSYRRNLIFSSFNEWGSFMYVCLSVSHICKNVGIEKFYTYVLLLICNIAIAFWITVSLIASMKTKDLKALMFYSKKKIEQ